MALSSNCMRFILLAVLVFGASLPSEAQKVKSPRRAVRNPHLKKRRRKLGKGKGGLFGREVSQDAAGVGAQGISGVNGQGFASSLSSKDAAGGTVQGVSPVDVQGFSSVNLLGSKGGRSFAATGGTFPSF